MNSPFVSWQIDEQIAPLLLLIQNGKFSDLDLALEKSNDSPSLDYVRMIGLSHRGRYREAFAISDRYIRQIPSGLWFFHHARNCIAIGRWSEALEFFDFCRAFGLFGDQMMTLNRPLWDREDLAGRTLAIHLEGGFGDQVCFSRFARDFERRGANVVLAGDAQLGSLIRTISPSITFVAREAIEAVEFDFWIPSLSAPRLLQLQEREIGGEPYLAVSDALKTKWSQLLGSRDGRLRVALCWQGNPGFAEDDRRSIEGELFTPLLDLEGYSFFKSQLELVNRGPNDSRIRDVTAHVAGPTDLAAYLSQMDLVISVDSAQAHVAGAIGVPTLLLNRVMSWWTFSGTPETHELQATPWYRDMRIVQQKAWGDWREVLERVRTLLKNRMTMGETSTPP